MVHVVKTSGSIWGSLICPWGCICLGENAGEKNEWPEDSINNFMHFKCLGQEQAHGRCSGSAHVSEISLWKDVLLLFLPCHGILQASPCGFNGCPGCQWVRLFHVIKNCLLFIANLILLLTLTWNLCTSGGMHEIVGSQPCMSVPAVRHAGVRVEVGCRGDMIAQAQCWYH